MGSLIEPIALILPALLLHFSVILLLIFLSLVGLLLYRFFVIFPKIACLHCNAEHHCPRAAMMGVRTR